MAYACTSHTTSGPVTHADTEITDTSRPVNHAWNTRYDAWNVSFVKNDWCWRVADVTVEQHLDAFNAMRDALAALGRPIVHSIHWNYDTINAPGCAADESCPLPNVSVPRHAA
jgi:hypothetical protein